MGSDELEFLCYDHGHKLFPSEAREALARISPDGQAMPFKHFQQWWESPNRFEKLGIDVLEMKTRHDVMEIWLDVDTDEDGIIEGQDFLTFFKKLSKSIPALQKLTSQEAMEAMDANGDRFVSFNEVVDYLAKEGHVEHWQN